LDLKSIDTFGLNVKPNTSNPIGYFGTGLKYAIAVLVRAGMKITIYVGQRQYEFYLKPDDFRGKEFNFVMMRQRSSWLSRWTSRALPFTTQFGKNWELWQAFRELESNTRDENGESFVLDLDVEPDNHSLLAVEGRTDIVVEGDEFVSVYERMGEVFLPGGLSIWDGNAQIQVIKQPSKALYYRGLKVMDLEKPSILTYNILADTQLTEDRTLKYTWQAKDSIAQYIACYCKDGQIMNEVISADANKYWEGTLDWEHVYTAPSDAFLNIIRKKKSRAQMTTLSRYVSPRIYGLYEKAQPTPPRIVHDVNGNIRDVEWWLKSGEISRYPELIKVLEKSIEILKTHHDYDQLRVVMVPKNTEIVDDIPF
jgi:hypothetical protein